MREFEEARGWIDTVDRQIIGLELEAQAGDMNAKRHRLAAAASTSTVRAD